MLIDGETLSSKEPTNESKIILGKFLGDFK
jgi:hypothetical protein